MPELIIRPFEPTDYPAWLPLWRGYQDFYHADIPQSVTDTTWTRFLNPAEPMFGALALHDHQPIGIVHWIFHRSCWTTGDYCYLQDLFVAPNTRGGGVGRKLIEHVYTQAAAAGCSRVHWLTHETNAQARLLYDRIADRSGFIQYRKSLANNP